MKGLRNYLGIGALCLGLSCSLVNKKVDSVPVLEQRVNCTEEGLNEAKSNGEDYWEFQKLCRENGKFISRQNKIQNYEEFNVVIGDIIKEYKEEFKFKGEKIEYNVVLFNGNNFDKAGYFSDKTNTVFIDLKGLEENAEIVYNAGSDSTLDMNNFNDFMFMELYNQIMKNTKNKTKEEFVDKFVEVISKSTIKHERMHKLYYVNSKSQEAIENESKVHLYQISEDQKFNSWVFLTTNLNSGYDRLYETLEENGYTKEELMKLTPKERAKIAKKIID